MGKNLTRHPRLYGKMGELRTADCQKSRVQHRVFHRHEGLRFADATARDRVQISTGGNFQRMSFRIKYTLDTEMYFPDLDFFLFYESTLFSHVTCD